TFAAQSWATESVPAAVNGDSMCSIVGSADGTTNIPAESRAAGPVSTGDVAAACGAAPCEGSASACGTAAGAGDRVVLADDGEKKLIAATPSTDATISTIPAVFDDASPLTPP